MKNYNIFFTSDTHFGHQNMCTFINYDGTRTRPFDTWQEADEKMIENWNKIVGPNDKVYHAGDIIYACEKKYAEQIMSRLNGKIHLIAGNHDLWKSNWYLKYCYQISGCKNFENFLISHVPVHPDSKGRFKLNLHGHIHCQEVTKIVDGERTKDPWYYNLCVDYKYSYAPIPYEEVQEYYQNCLDAGLLVPPPQRKRDF